jgi:hypothetical protein
MRKKIRLKKSQNRTKLKRGRVVNSGHQGDKSYLHNLNKKMCGVVRIKNADKCFKAEEPIQTHHWDIEKE